MRTTDVLRRHRRTGVPLSLYLVALVLVPLLGVLLTVGALVQARATEAAGADRSEQDVAELARLDLARSGIEQEVLPTLSRQVVANPATAAGLGLSSALLAGQLQAAETAQSTARAATDDALAQAFAGTRRNAGTLADATTTLQRLRAGADTGSMSQDRVYLGYLALSNQLMNAQDDAAATARSTNVSPRTQRAVDDVQVLARLAQAASRQMPVYLGTIFAPENTTIGSQLSWETAWLAYTDARDQLDSLSQDSLTADWAEVYASPAVQQVEGALTPAGGTDLAGRPLPELVGLLFASLQRDSSIADLVTTAADNAEALATADHDRAVASLTTTAAVGSGVLLLSLAGAVLLGRRVSRSLRLLAGQAQQVSEGTLIDVEVAGPREVRTVSSALGSAVASLRRIQDQARAVADGDLDNALVRQPLPGALGEVVHASVQQIVASVRQREELQSALAHQAAHDPLTDLPNRAQALTLTTSALFRAQRTGDMTGLLFVDLDGFKGVNDSHGHAAGDEVLREAARRLRATVRAGDVVCRLGGDEFVVLVEPVESERDLLDLAERLISAVSDPMQAGEHQVRIGASVGVAVSRDAETDADVLFAEADAAAYRAKRQGRGRAELFDEDLRAQLTARAELEAAITAGLANGEFVLDYQPVVDTASGRLTGYEALVRWRRPGHGLVPPDSFIPTAEASQLICELDRWVLHEATRQLAEWRAGAQLGPDETEPTIAVNISGRHLAERRVVADVADALAAAGLPARLLVLEVTETVLVDDPAAMDHLASLRELGAGIAIDDFGTGYTSIGQLRHMPVDTLKIDRSFIASADPAHRQLVSLIIQTAHAFGLTVVAEGVEEPAQLAWLQAGSCDLAQGYLLHRPMPAAAAGALLLPAVTTPVG